MAESVYKVIELIGTSTVSWEKAAAAAVKTASLSLRDLRIAEVSQLDMQIMEGKAVAYRAKVKVSFKYLTGDEKPSETGDAPKAPRKAPRAKAAVAEEAPAPVKKAPRKAKRKG